MNKSFARLWCLRVSSAASFVAASYTALATVTPIASILASSKGVWGNSLTASIEAATDGVASHWNLIIKRGGVEVQRHINLDTTSKTYAVLEEITSGIYVQVNGMGNAGRPDDVADQALASGAEGAFVDTDYTGSIADNRGIRVLYDEQHTDLRHIFVGEYGSAAVDAELLLMATTTKTKIVYINGDLGDEPSDVVTDVGSYRSDRGVYSWPFVKTFSADANQGNGGIIDVFPNSWAAALVASVAPGEDPAGAGLNLAHANVLAGMRGLDSSRNEWANHALLNENGIAIFQFASESQRFTMRNGVTTSVNPALTQIDRRTLTDFLQESIAKGLVPFQNFAMNEENQISIKGIIERFLRAQQKLGIIPTQDDLDAFKNPTDPALFPFEVDIISGNTPASKATGLFVVIVRVRSFPHMRFIVLQTEIGQGVEITEIAA